MKNTFQSWVDSVAKNQTPEAIQRGDVVKSSSGTNFGAVEFLKFQKNNFVAEVGKKGDYYIYHVYPAEKWQGRLPSFFYPMMGAFQQMFKDNGEIEHEWVEEMMSYALRVSGWTNHVWGDELAIRAIDVTDSNLDEQEAQYETKPISK